MTFSKDCEFSRIKYNFWATLLSLLMTLSPLGGLPSKSCLEELIISVRYS